MLLDGADRGDEVAREALRRIGDWLGIGVANLFNPGMVIFGGMLRDVYPDAAPQVRHRIATNVLPVARERVRLRTSALGDDSTLVGAAELGYAADRPTRAIFTSVDCGNVLSLLMLRIVDNARVYRLDRVTVRA